MRVLHTVCDRGRTQVEAGSRTVLGIGPGRSSVLSDGVLSMTLLLLHSTGRASQQSDGTSPVTLDILYRTHEVLSIPPPVHNHTLQHYNTSRPAGFLEYPILSRKVTELAAFFHSVLRHRILSYILFLFMVRERLNAAEISVTWLHGTISPSPQRSWVHDTYVKPCTALPRLEWTLTCTDSE